MSAPHSDTTVSPGVESDNPMGSFGTDEPQTFAQSMSIDAAQSDHVPGQRGWMSSVGLIAGIVLVSGAVLMGMRKLGTKGVLDTLDIKIDYPLEQVDAARNAADHAKILSDLGTAGTLSQVPVEALSMNPFTWKGLNTEVAAVPRAIPVGETDAQRRAREHAERLAKVSKTFETLTLNSIMGGPNPVASINGELVSEGDTVAGLFVVHAIFGRQVELLAEGEMFSLAMGE